MIKKCILCEFVTSTRHTAFSIYMLSIHCRCVTNILRISTKKFDPENNMIDLQGFEHSYIAATLHCGGGGGGILKALLAANLLLSFQVARYIHVT